MDAFCGERSVHRGFCGGLNELKTKFVFLMWNLAATRVIWVTSPLGSSLRHGVNTQAKTWIQPRLITEVNRAMQGLCPRSKFQDTGTVAIASVVSKRNGPMVRSKTHSWTSTMMSNAPFCINGIMLEWHFETNCLTQGSVRRVHRCDTRPALSVSCPMIESSNFVHVKNALVTRTLVDDFFDLPRCIYQQHSCEIEMQTKGRIHACCAKAAAGPGRGAPPRRTPVFKLCLGECWNLPAFIYLSRGRSPTKIGTKSKWDTGLEETNCDSSILPSMFS